MAGFVIQGRFPHGLTRIPQARQKLVTRGATAIELSPSLRFAVGSGQALPPAVLQRMEALFGARFHDVRVHVGSHVNAIGATAFTQGANIHFAPGHYDFETPHGRSMLAHELTHVVQQRSGRVRNPFGSGIAVLHDQLLEAEADRMAQKVMLMPQPAVAQRMVLIDKERLAPAGRQATAIWETLKHDLLDMGLTPYGLRQRFLGFLRDEELHYAGDENGFRGWFLERITELLQREDLRRQFELDLGADEKRRRTVHRFVIRRPPWPKGYREQLGAKPGDDLRHIIRNATILRALDDEKEVLTAQRDGSQLLAYYREMASQLGVELRDDHHLEQFRLIYQKLYLNIENLFAGPGGVNQAIGFSADRVTNIGLELEGKGNQQVVIGEVVDQVWAILDDYIRQMQRKAERLPVGRGEYVRGLQAYKENLVDYLKQLRMVWEDENGPRAEAADLAGDVIDIGDNLGFDLVLAEDVAERQKPLIEVETALHGNVTPGTHALTRIFRKFLGLQGAPVQVHVPRIVSRRKPLRKPVKIRKTSRTANVALKAVTEYLVAEILELAGNQAKGLGRRRITPRDIEAALKSDPHGLGKVFRFSK